MATHLIVVDDHQLVRQSLVRLLQVLNHCEVVGEAASGEEALRLADRLKPDLVLMDLKLPDRNGIEVTRDLKEKHPAMGVVMVTMYADAEHAAEAMRAGASAFLSKNVSVETLLHAIEIVRAGGSFFAEAAIAHRVFGHLTGRERSGDALLTERQRSMLRLLAQGATNAEIAQRLYLSEKTVKQYLHGLFHKLGVKDRTEAAAVAERRGLVI